MMSSCLRSSMRRAMVRWLLGLMGCLVLGAVGAEERNEQAQQVLVGGYSFPPFVDGNAGVTIDLIAALNAVQSQFKFVFVPTSARRRYGDMANGVFDVMFFESMAWGWDKATVEESRVYLKGDGEVYVALRKPGRDQAFFTNLAERTLIGVAGYHYGFANFNADPVELSKRFKITFADDAAAMLRMLLNERGEVGVVTRSYLQGYLLTQPQLRDKLLVSKRFDQTYNHTFVVRKGSAVNAKAIEAIIGQLEKTGKLRALWAQHGIAK